MDELGDNLKRKTIPSLNGLRGVSALSVALAHASGLARWIPADYAVVLFFEISGLLITWLLLTEQEQTGTIDRFNFMKRRTLRLFPAFYACWAVCWLVPGVPGRWWAMFYMMDFYNALYALPGTITDVLDMCWSLGIEEKYYLAWPSILQRFSHRALLKGLLVLLVLVQIYHVVVFKLGHVMWAAWGFDTRIDAILLGSALAIALKSGWRPPQALLQGRTGQIFLWASLGLVVLLSGVAWVHRLGYGVLISVYPLAIILLSVIARPPRILNNPVASYFGKISYSLYLFNPVVIYFVSRLSFLHVGARGIAGLAGSILAAMFSYHFIESPFLNLKARAHRPVTNPTFASPVAS